MAREPTFRDRAKIYVAAGSGGNGCVSFRREKYVPRGGPDGGDGGRGGHVYLRVDPNVDSLLHLYYQPHQRASRGGHGRGKKCHGKNGDDWYIHVPAGTIVREADSDRVLGELVSEHESLRVAQGGAGGLGNCHFVTSSHRAPRESTEGEPGEEKTLLLELKLVADVGLVGYPNAGKSTLLRAISGAKPKTASYPFTTLHPVIGTVIFDDYHTLRVADIPGLIEGAHKGVGLGHDFLRHIERTTFLLFVIDMAGVDGRDPVDDYAKLREELRRHHPDLERRPYLVVANKMDLEEAELFFADFCERTGEVPLKMSATRGQGIDPLKRALREATLERA